MKLRKSSFTRGPIGYPTVLLVGAWVSLWLLWPQVKSSRVRAGRLPEPRVSYIPLQRQDAITHRSPVLFARGSRLGFSLTTDEEGTAAAFSPGPSPAEPTFLEPATFPAPKQPPMRIGREGLTPAHYRPEWAASGLTIAATNRQPKLLVEPSPTLKECGFQIPEELAAKVVGLGMPCLLTAHVEMTRDGRVRNVFLEDPSGDGALNRAVLGMLEKAILRRHGAPCAGKVLVSFGR